MTRKVIDESDRRATGRKRVSCSEEIEDFGRDPTADMQASITMARWYDRLIGRNKGIMYLLLQGFKAKAISEMMGMKEPAVRLRIRLIKASYTKTVLGWPCK